MKIIKCIDEIVKCIDEILKCFDEIVNCFDEIVNCIDVLGHCNAAFYLFGALYPAGLFTQPVNMRPFEMHPVRETIKYI
jgi:hypothetical protein